MGGNMKKKIAAFVLLLCAGCAGVCEAAFLLPVAREVTYSDASGKSWREEGRLHVSVTAAQQMWELALRRDGWRFVRGAALDAADFRHLELWEKGEENLLLCLWSAGPGKSGYMWGTTKPKSQGKE